MDKTWFRELRLGAFIHFGLYSILGGRWKDHKVDYIGEWIQSLLRIPNAEYTQLASQFNPTEFDADKIVAAFAAAGLRYLVFTAKHHDGFCLFDTKYSDYNSVKASPCHRDFVRELSEACARHGVKMGIYYSHCLDWHEKNAADPREFPKNMNLCSWGNDWDFPEKSEKDFEAFFSGKVLPQLEELLTNYGPISVVWCDCPFPDITPERAKRLYDLVHKLQPNCLVNGRLCGSQALGDYGCLSDNAIPAGTAKEDYPTEALITLNDTWGFKFDDNNWKSADTVENIALDVAQGGSTLLVNFGPDGNGRIPAPCMELLEKMSQWHRGEVAEALHCDGRNPLPQQLDWCRLIAKGRKLWIFPRRTAGDTAQLSGIEGMVVNCSCELQRISSGTFEFRGLKRFAEENKPVLLRFHNDPVYDPHLRLQNGRLSLSPEMGVIQNGTDDGNQPKNIDLVDPAGQSVSERHCSFTEDGGLRNWANPSDSITWECFLNAGTYRLRLLTRQMWHRKAWDSARVVKLVLNGEVREITLKADEREEDNQYYQGAYSELGSVTLAADGLLKATLSTVVEPDPEAEIRLDCLEIRK